MPKALVIPVSFKRTKRELELYEILFNLDDKSHFVKKALEFYLQYNDKKINIIEEKKEEPKEKKMDDKTRNAIASILGD